MRIELLAHCNDYSLKESILYGSILHDILYEIFKTYFCFSVSVSKTITNWASFFFGATTSSKIKFKMKGEW